MAHSNALQLIDNSGVSGTDLLINTTTPTFEGSAEPGSQVELSVDGSVRGATSADVNGDWTFTIAAGSDLTEGEHSVSVSYVPIGGTESGQMISDEMVITIDITPPEITSGDTAEEIQENSGAYQIIYTATSTDESAVRYTLKDGDSDHFTIGSRNGEVTLTENPDFENKSAYSFTVVATDDAGNESLEQLVNLSITDQHLSAPQLIDESDASIDSDGITNDATPTFIGTAPANSKVDVLLDGLAPLGSTDDVGHDGRWEVTSQEDLADGSHAITYIFTPDGGAPSDQSDSLNITVDATPPEFTSGATAYAIEENSGANQVIYTATSTDASPVIYTLKGGDSDHFTINETSGDVTLNPNPDYEQKFAYQFTVKATDIAGNFSNQLVDLEITDQVVDAPQLIDESDDTVDSDAITADPTPTFIGTAPAQSLVKVYKGGALLGATSAEESGDWTLPNGQWILEAGDKLTDGSHEITYTFTPDGGTTSDQSDPLDITIDTTLPSITSGDTANEIEEDSGANQVIYTATAVDESEVFYSLDQTVGDYEKLEIDKISGEVTLTENPSYELKPNYHFTVVATDIVGNAEEQEVSLSVIDKLSFIDDSWFSPSDNLVNTTTPALEGSAKPNTEVRVFVDEQPIGVTETNGSGHWVYTVPTDVGLTDGEHTVKVTSTPAAGESPTTSRPIVFTIDTTPPEFTSSDTANPIEENSGANQIVYTATSTDESSVTYNLGDSEESGNFSIISNGTVVLEDNPDHEAISDYEFTIYATDAAGNSSSQVVDLKITDQVVPAPVLVDESSGWVDIDGLTNDTTPTFVGFAPTGREVSIQIIDDSGNVRLAETYAFIMH